MAVKNQRFLEILSIFKSRILNISSRGVKKVHPIIEKSRRLRSHLAGHKNARDYTNDPVWEYTMRDPDELTATDDDNDSITVAQCAALHGRVKSKVSQWMDGWENDDVLGNVEVREFTEVELATMEAEEINEDTWPEHLIAFEIGENSGRKSQGPSFVQLDWKRALALVETREMGWEAFHEEHENVPNLVDYTNGDSW